MCVTLWQLTMKLLFFLFLIVSFSLTACGGGSALPPNQLSVAKNLLWLDYGGFKLLYDCDLKSANRFEYKLGKDTGNFSRPTAYRPTTSRISKWRFCLTENLTVKLCSRCMKRPSTITLYVVAYKPLACEADKTPPHHSTHCHTGLYSEETFHGNRLESQWNQGSLSSEGGNREIG